MAKADGNSRKSAADVVARVRSEIAGLLSIDPDKASFSQRLKLDYATGLRLELDRLQARQLAGEAIDLTRFTNAAAELERLLPAADTSSWDLSRLSDDEVAIMEKIGRKATGDDTVGDAVPAFRLEFVRPDGKPDDDSEEVSSLKSRIAELEGRVATLTEMNGNQVQQIVKLQGAATISPPPSAGYPCYQAPRLVVAEAKAEPEKPEPKAQKPAAPQLLGDPIAEADRMYRHLAIGPVHQPPQGWANPINEERRRKP